MIKLNKYIANFYNSDIIISNFVRGIAKDITIHSLRHSFAAHLLEDGVGLRDIQELLSHKSSKITEIYTNVSRRDIGRIKSSLDLAEGI